MRNFIRNLWLLSFLVAPLLAYAGEAEKGKDAAKKEDEEKEEEQPKEKPFKYSAWCAFRDLSLDYLEPKKDPLTYETRPISRKWQGFGRRGHWAALILEVKNTTKDEVYKGTATINLPPLNGGPDQTPPYLTAYRQDFEVAGQSEKQYHFSVLCPEDNPSLVTIEVEANGRSYDSRSVFLHDLCGEDFIVVVSESSGAFRHLAYKKALPGEMEEDVNARRRRVAVVEPAELPSRWHDLTMADLIILDGPPREKLTAAQWDALKTYAQAGGHILITAGKDPSRLKGPLEELAGVSVREMAEVESLDEIQPPLPSPRPGWKLPLLDVKAAADAKAVSDVRYNHKNRYIEMCRRHYGAGSVTFLPFSLSDPLLENWEGRGAIPVSILEASRGRAVFARENQEEEPANQQNLIPRRGTYTIFVSETQAPAANTLWGLRHELDESFANDTVVKHQSPGTVLGFLLLYLLCAVPGNYLLFGWFKRREVAWLAVPLWVLTFCGAAYALKGQTGRLTVNEVSVVEAGPAQNVGVARTFVGLYAPYRDDYGLFFPPDLQAAPGHLLNMAQERRNLDVPEIYLVDGDAGLSIEKLRVQARATRQLEVVHRVNLGGGLEVRVKPQAGAPNIFNVEAHNGMPFPLYNLTLFYEGRAIELTEKGPSGEILAAGESRSLEGVGGPALAWKKADEAFFGKQPRFVLFKEDARKKCTGFVNNYVRERIDKFKEPVVCAWVDTQVLPVAVAAGGNKPEKPGQEEGLTLLVAPVPIKETALTVVPKRSYGIRYANDAAAIERPQCSWWNSLNEKSCAPMVEEKPAQKNVTGRSYVVYLQLAVPEDYRQLEKDLFQLRLSGSLGVDESKLPPPKPGRMAIPPGEHYTGELKIEVFFWTDGNVPSAWEPMPGWDDKVSPIFDVQLNKPWKLPPAFFPLDKHQWRVGNVINLRVTAKAENAICPLELKGLKLEAAKK